MSTSTHTAQSLSEILKRDPATDWALSALADIYLKSGRLREADLLLRKAITINPNSVEAHVCMGRVMSERNELSAGEFHLRQALVLSPQNADAHADLALNLARQGLTDEAHEHYASALEIKPGDVRIIAYWSKLHELCGDLDEADRLLSRAESIAPGEVDLLRATFDARTGQAEKAIRLLDNRAGMNGDALLERGRLNDKLKNYDSAWADFEAANQWFTKAEPTMVYNRSGVEDFFAKLRSFFVHETVSRLPFANVRPGTPQPIFIVGSPRSGTTMIEQMLASHSEVVGGGELPFLADLRVFSEKIAPGTPFPQNLTQTFFGDMRHSATLFRDYYFARAAERGLLRRSGGYFTDKMPFNEIYLPILRMAFPEAAVIHLVRHPLDICVSMFANKLNHGFHCAYRLEDITHHLLAVHQLHTHYRSQMATGEIIVHYESFVEQQLSETQRLLKFIGLPFDDACIEFHTSNRYSPTPSYASVKEAVSTKSVNRHSHYTQQLQSVRDGLRPIFDAYGYGD